MSRREELGHPLGSITPPIPPTPLLPTAAAAAAAAGASTAPFVLEVGTEELPPDDLLAGLGQLRSVHYKDMGH